MLLILSIAFSLGYVERGQWEKNAIGLELLCLLPRSSSYLKVYSINF